MLLLLYNMSFLLTTCSYIYTLSSNKTLCNTLTRLFNLVEALPSCDWWICPVAAGYVFFLFFKFN